MPYILPNGQYPYPLNYLASDGGTDLTPFVVNDPFVEIGSTNWYVLCLTTDELSDLISVLSVGAPIALPDSYNTIIQKYMQMREFPNEIPLGSCMDLCQLIIDCIEETPALQQTINNSVAGFTNQNGSPAEYNQEVFPPPVNCDKDATWGYVDALWNFIHTNNVDFLQQLNEATNQAGQINTLLSFIPAFEQIPVSDILEWIENLGEYNLDAYNASVTVAIQDQIRCDLFCIAVNNNCSITFGDVYEYFEAQFGGLNAPTLGATFLELVIFMITGNYPNDRIIYLWSLVQLGFAFIGAEFLGINSISQYAIQAQNGDPDNNWSLLCAPCVASWSKSWDFTLGSFASDGWAVGNWGDGWFNGLGYRSQNNSTQEINYLNVTFPQESTVNFYEFTFASTAQSNFAGGGGVFITASYVLNGIGTETLRIPSAGLPINVNRVMYNGVDLQADIVRTQSNPKFTGSGKWYITACTIKGTGVNPYP